MKELLVHLPRSFMSSVLMPFLARMVMIPGRKHLAVRFNSGDILLNISVMCLGVTSSCPPGKEKSGLAPAGLAFLALTQASKA